MKRPDGNERLRFRDLKKGYFYQGENACINPPFWIQVAIYKKDIETGKTLPDVPFSIEQWDETIQDYVPYELEQQVQTDLMGRQKQKNFIIPEKIKESSADGERKAPEAYFGDYKRKIHRKEEKRIFFRLRRKITEKYWN